MSSIKIDIEEIFEAYDRLKIINGFDLMDIEFCTDGQPIHIDPEVKKRFQDWTGLTNIDFITSNYYLKEAKDE